MKRKKLKERTKKLVKSDRLLAVPSKKIAKAMILTGMFGMCSCSGIIASRDAIEAMNRGAIGIIEQTKASPDTKTAYFENENIIARQRGGLLSKWFGRDVSKAKVGK